jgi:hypothetical protein
MEESGEMRRARLPERVARRSKTRKIDDYADVGGDSGLQLAREARQVWSSFSDSAGLF